LQSCFLQIDVAKIVIHKTDQPNTLFHFFDTDRLTSEDRTEIDFFSVKADTSAAGDVDSFVVEDSPVPVGRDKERSRNIAISSCPEGSLPFTGSSA
jgi:hypothetical protein